MKKKKWLIPLIIVVLLIITFVAGVGTLLSKGYGASTGVYLESKDGVAMLIRDKAPIILSSKHNGDMFSELDVGDKFFVIHDGVEESYPARTCAYAVFKLSDGKASDVPQTVIDELIELGWLKEGEIE